MSTPTVRQRVLDLLAETDLCDPHAITEALLGELKGARARSALAELLPGYVRVIINSDRNGFTPERGGDRPGPAIDVTKTQTSPAGPGQTSKSTKWEAARHSIFRHRVQVDHDYLLLGDLTVEQVGWLVDDRYAKAKTLTSKGDRYAALRDLMQRRKATRVRDLAEDEVAEVLS